MNQQRPSMVLPALLGGVFLGFTSALPIVGMLNCACCLLVMGGGVLSTYLYMKDYPPSLPPINFGDAALLGLLTGLFGGLVWVAVEIPVELIKLQIGLGATDLAQLEEVLDRPEIPPPVREFLSRLLSQGALSAGMIFFSLITNMVISLIFATIGSILGLAIFDKKLGRKEAVPPPAPPGVEAG